MQSFSHGPLQLAYSGLHGTVLDQTKFSETHISSYGGGGNLQQGTGRVSAPTLATETITKHEFWVELTDGTHHPIQLKGLDIPLSKGQAVTLVYAQNGANDTSELALIANHAAKRYWRVADTPTLLEMAGDKTGRNTITIVIVALVTWFASSLVMGAMIGIGGFFYFRSRYNKAYKALEDHLHEVGGFALNQGVAVPRT